MSSAVHLLVVLSGGVSQAAGIDGKSRTKVGVRALCKPSSCGAVPSACKLDAAESQFGGAISEFGIAVVSETDNAYVCRGLPGGLGSGSHAVYAMLSKRWRLADLLWSGVWVRVRWVKDRGGSWVGWRLHCGVFCWWLCGRGWWWALASQSAPVGELLCCC